MKVVADESVDRQIVDRLRRDGHALFYVAEMAPGISDDVVLGLATRESALLLTADKDFGESVFRHGHPTHGIVLIRLAGLAPLRKAEMVSSAIDLHISEMRHAFSVITAGAIRIRRPGE